MLGYAHFVLHHLSSRAATAEAQCSFNVQSLGAGSSPTAAPSSVSVAGRRLLAQLRRLLQSSGVQVNLDINAPSDLSSSVNQALQQAINSGAFQASLESNGVLPWPLLLNMKHLTEVLYRDAISLILLCIDKVKRRGLFSKLCQQ